MKWEKKGLVFSVDNNAPWCRTHAANPYPEYVGEDVWRIYFNGRDAINRSYITYIEFDVLTMEILKGPGEKLLEPGAPGLFDDSGCSLGSVITTPEGEKRIYYMGWHLGKVAPWSNFIGMAVYDKGENRYRKYSRVPIIDRTDTDPFSISFPEVIYENGQYRMWYGTVDTWDMDSKERDYGLKCRIKTGTSKDGIHWETDDNTCLEGNDESEYAFSGVTVFKEEGLYKMFYSYRGKKYRIGYAESRDGYEWIRKDDEAGIDVSETGWDSDMIEYPSIFDHKGERYMLYCGNGYGKSGFGLAKLVGR